MAKLKPPRKRHRRPIHGRIRQYREARDWTQTEFAAELGVDKTRVWHWENGDTAPNWRILPRVAEVLGVTVDDLLGSGRRAA